MGGRNRVLFRRGPPASTGQPAVLKSVAHLEEAPEIELTARGAGAGLAGAWTHNPRRAIAE